MCGSSSSSSFISSDLVNKSFLLLCILVSYFDWTRHDNPYRLSSMNTTVMAFSYLSLSHRVRRLPSSHMNPTFSTISITTKTSPVPARDKCTYSSPVQFSSLFDSVFDSTNMTLSSSSLTKNTHEDADHPATESQEMSSQSPRKETISPERYTVGKEIDSFLQEGIGQYWSYSVPVQKQQATSSSSLDSAPSIFKKNRTKETREEEEQKKQESQYTQENDIRASSTTTKTEQSDPSAQSPDPTTGASTQLYDMGLGKNMPVNTIETNDKKGMIFANDSEGIFLCRALWLYGENKEEEAKWKDSQVADAHHGIDSKDTTLETQHSSPNMIKSSCVDGHDSHHGKRVDSISPTLDDTSNSSTSSMASMQGSIPLQQMMMNDKLKSLSLPTAIRYEDIDSSIPPSMYDPSKGIDLVWQLLRQEAQREAEREPLLVSFIYSTILNHRTLESALAFHLSNRMSSPAMISTQIMSLFQEVFETETSSSLTFGINLRADIMAVRDRDPACTCLPDVFLYFKGFHALQTHRVAHYLWKSGRKTLAHFLQSRMAQIFQIDIHPNASIGRGIMFDHGTGIVIGETAVLGDNCSILHHVTLGGTGSGRKGTDRHPKVGQGVLLGAGSTILGNIKIGDGCQIGAGTLVIADLPAHSVAVGVPAKIIGKFVNKDTEPSRSMNQMLVSKDASSKPNDSPSGVDYDDNTFSI